MTFVPAWRRAKSAAFDLETNSTARAARTLDLWGTPRRVYANANLSIYSAQACNARCTFCVEELRPASRGGALAAQKTVERDDDVYFARLVAALDELAPLDPSVSITGGEASKDPRLPRLLALLSRRGARKRTLTTNGSGLLDAHDGRTVLDSIVENRLDHLNVSIAHSDPVENARLMRYRAATPPELLRRALARLAAAGVRVRLSCVLLEDGIRDLAGIRAYLDFAESLGVDNVIFRQLMRTDPDTHVENEVVRYSDAHRVRLEPLLDLLDREPGFALTRQIVGYYYYVEVWRARGLDVVFEEADLGELERARRRDPDTIHELVFHPNGRLASTWQPWDGLLDPPAGAGVLREPEPHRPARPVLGGAPRLFRYFRKRHRSGDRHRRTHRAGHARRRARAR